MRPRLRTWLNPRRLSPEGLATFLIGTVVAGLYLAPILWSGLVGPDANDAHDIAIAARLHLTTSQAFALAAKELWTTNGGLFPLSAVPLAFWFLGPSEIAAKIAGFALVLLNFATFIAFVRTASRSDRFALLATAITLCAVQLRKPHDPLLENAIATPWSAELILLALLFWALFVRLEKTWAALAFPSIYLLAALTSVLAYPLALAFAYVGLTSKRASIRIVSFGGAALVPLLLALSWVLHATIPRAIAVAATNGKRYFHDVAWQIVAAVPMSYRASGNVVRSNLISNLIKDDRFANIPNITLVGYLAALATAIIVLVALWKSTRPRMLGIDGISIVAAGLALWGGCALVLGPRAEWFSSFSIGQAYDGVYLECFGFGLTVAFLLRQVALAPARSVARSFIPVIASFVAFFLIYGNVRVNDLAVENSRNLDAFRWNVDEARTIFKIVPAGALLVIDPDYPVPISAGDPARSAENLLFHYTGRRFDVVSPVGFLHVHARREAWYVRSEGRRDGEPALALYRMGTPQHGDLVADRAVVYRRFPSLAERALAAEPVADDRAGLHKRTRFETPAVAVAFLQRTCGPVKLKDMFAPQRPSIVFGSGFVTPEVVRPTLFIASNAIPQPPDRDPQWRFASRSATLIVEGDACARGKIHLTAQVATGAPARLIVRTGQKTMTLRVSEAGAMLDVFLPNTPFRKTIITLSTDAPRRADIFPNPRADRVPDPDYRMLVFNIRALEASRPRARR